MERCDKPVLLGGWLGLPYEDEGCIKFCATFYREMGIEADEQGLKQARNFTRVRQARFGDIVVFRGAPFDNQFHIGVMLDSRIAIQCNNATNGVGKIDVTRYPFNVCFKGFYRHDELA